MSVRWANRLWKRVTVVKTPCVQCTYTSKNSSPLRQVGSVLGSNGRMQTGARLHHFLSLPGLLRRSDHTLEIMLSAERRCCKAGGTTLEAPSAESAMLLFGAALMVVEGLLPTCKPSADAHLAERWASYGYGEPGRTMQR